MSDVCAAGGCTRNPRSSRLQDVMQSPTAASKATAALFGPLRVIASIPCSGGIIQTRHAEFIQYPIDFRLVTHKRLVDRILQLGPGTLHANANIERKWRAQRRGRRYRKNLKRAVVVFGEISAERAPDDRDIDLAIRH